MVSPDDIITEADSTREAALEHVRDAANFFHDHEGDLLERSEALTELQETLDIDEYSAQTILQELVGDLVDPITQIRTKNGRYIGVIEYVEGDGWYGYVDYNDIRGKQKTVVCAQCVHEADYDNEVTFAREGDGSFTDGECDYNELAAAVEEHYQTNHDTVPEDVETGASLISGTTIGGNTAWHAGNDGGGSGLAADTVDGQHYTDIQTWVNNNASARDDSSSPLIAEVRSDDPSNPEAGRIWVHDG